MRFVKWLRLIFVHLMLLTIVSDAFGQSRIPVVVDSETHKPLANASVFDRKGKFIGISDAKGVITCASVSDYPITVRYMGFYERTVAKSGGVDTIFMRENAKVLPEVVVMSKRMKVLHILAYVREYSTLSTYTDTVTLFREKMVDFMLPNDDRTRFKGWRYPRVLNSRSYYQFTNGSGLDSVSDRCNHHFTWSDWVGVLPSKNIPKGIVSVENGVDTVWGKYSATEVWTKKDDKISVDVDVMADTASRVWVPNISTFFMNDNMEFERFGLRLNYGNVVGNKIDPADLTGYSFNIESRGRGRSMFRFNRYDKPFFVTTYTEVYMLDKEYISVKEAKKWEQRKFDANEIEIYEPQDAPDLHPSIQAVVDRVNNVDVDKTRLAQLPHYRIAARKVVKQDFGSRALNLLKALTGISSFKAKRNMNKQWRDFQINQVKRNQASHAEQIRRRGESK